MAGEGIKEKTINNITWSFLERIGAQVISFIVSIVLARLLLPEEYGIVALVTTFIAILNVFVSEGFPKALIQKKDSDNLDFSSVLYFNIVFSIFLFILIWFLAPVLSTFYDYNQLTWVIRIMGIKVVIASVNSVQVAYVSKQLVFKKFFWATLIGTVVSAIVGIILAYQGFGVWALVAQYLSNSLIDCVVLFFAIKWKPILKFSASRLKPLIKYGWKVLGAGLIATGYNELRSLLIGKVYSSEDLAYYNKGKQFPHLFVDNICVAVSNVMLPVISEKQNDPVAVKNIVRQSLRVSSFILFPIMVGLAVVAKPLVIILLTDKWIECVPYLQILCINCALMPMQSINQQAIYAIGKSGTALFAEILKKSFGIVMIVISINISVKAVAVFGIITGVFCSIVNAFPNKKYIGYSYWEQIADLIPFILLSFSMGFIVWTITLFNLNIYVQLVLQVLSGITFYVGMSVLFKIDSFYICINYIKKLLNRKGAKNE